MKRRFGKSVTPKGECLELDITSLLDILVILLVFLLKSYNATDLKLEVVKHLTLPHSKSRTLGSHAVIIQVNKYNNLWINNKHVGNIAYTGEKISLLYNVLDKIKKEDEKISRLPANEQKKRRRKVNIVLDKELPYKKLRQVMHTAALAGYPEFKLIVQGNYK